MRRAYTSKLLNQSVAGFWFFKAALLAWQRLLVGLACKRKEGISPNDSLELHLLDF